MRPGDTNDVPGDPNFDEPEGRAISRSKGRDLLDRYWGRYVACFNDTESGERHLLRDPSGQMQCYHLEYGGVHLYFRDIRDALPISGFRCDFDKQSLVLGFFAAGHIDRQTGISGITEVLAGERQCIANDTVRRDFPWSPAKIAARCAVPSFDKAVKRLQRVVQGSINAWASAYPSVAQLLSGGVDSSIVLAALHSAPNRPDMVGINMYTEMSEGDERTYAMAAAEKAQCELRSFSLGKIELPELISWVPFSAKPLGNIYGYQSDLQKIEIVTKHGAEACFSGHGGDELFLELKGELIAADFVRHHGIGRAFLKEVLDQAIVARNSYWYVLRKALSHGFLRLPLDPRPRYAPDALRFFSKDAQQLYSRCHPLHPWSVAGQGIPPGKAVQIFSLPKALHFHNISNLDKHVDVVFPLLSQPIIEACLETPTFLLTHKRRTRAVARAAFAGLCPDAILNRRDKGSTGEHFGNVIGENMTFVRKFLLDGIMARIGLLDTEEIAGALGMGTIVESENIRVLLNFVSTEAWMRAVESGLGK